MGNLDNPGRCPIAEGIKKTLFIVSVHRKIIECRRGASGKQLWLKAFFESAYAFTLDKLLNMQKKN